MIEASGIVLMWSFARPLAINLSMNASFNQWMGEKLGQLGSFLAIHIDWWLPVLAIAITGLLFRLYERSLHLRKIQMKTDKERQPQQNQESQDAQQTQALDITTLMKDGGGSYANH